MHSWDKLWTTRYKKTQKTQLSLLKSWEQKQGTALNTTERVGKPLSHPSGPTPGHTPTLTPCKEPAHPTLPLGE